MNKRESQWVHEDGYGGNGIPGIFAGFFLIIWGLIQLVIAGIEHLTSNRKHHS